MNNLFFDFYLKRLLFADGNNAIKITIISQMPIKTYLDVLFHKDATITQRFLKI